MDFRQKAGLLSRMDFINVFLFSLKRLEEWSNYLQGIASGSVIYQAWSFKSAANTRQELIKKKKKKKKLPKWSPTTAAAINMTEKICHKCKKCTFNNNTIYVVQM